MSFGRSGLSTEGTLNFASAVPNCGADGWILLYYTCSTSGHGSQKGFSVKHHHVSLLLIRRYFWMTFMDISESVFSTSMTYLFPVPNENEYSTAGKKWLFLRLYFLQAWHIYSLYQTKMNTILLERNGYFWGCIFYKHDISILCTRRKWMQYCWKERSFPFDFIFNVDVLH